MRKVTMIAARVFAGAGLLSGAAPAPARAAHAAPMAMPQQAARFGHQVNGVTVSERGRMSVNVPDLAVVQPGCAAGPADPAVGPASAARPPSHTRSAGPNALPS